MTRGAILHLQTTGINRLLRFLRTGERATYYRAAEYDLRDVRAPEELSRLPILHKATLVQNAEAFRTQPSEKYVRLHRTSGTSSPDMLSWLDTSDDWNWWLRCWRASYEAAELRPGDALFFPCNFNFFIGFWSAFDSAHTQGYRAIAGGGQDSLQRVKNLLAIRPTAFVSTPSYAFRLAQVATEHNIEPTSAGVRKIILAGEAGGCVPEIRRALAALWGAEIFDHYGATEVGALGYQCTEDHESIHLNEREYYFEVLDPRTWGPCSDGELGALVVTNFNRLGSPLLRYCTNDLVKVTRERCACGRSEMRAVGGVQARADDMVVIKGTNVLPKDIEALMRGIEVQREWRCRIDPDKRAPVLEITIEESDGGRADTIAEKIRERFSLSPKIVVLQDGALSRFEGKAKRCFVTTS